MHRTWRVLLGEKNHLGRRYAMFLLGLFVCSFGVALTTKAGLGTSPVTCIPYTLALILPGLSFGNWLILFCFAQILVQILLLRRRCVPSELLIQAVLGFAYGYLTDLSMFLLRNLAPVRYPVRLCILALGCAVLAFGVYLELVGDVGMLSGDAFIKAIAQVAKKPYSNIKIKTDISMCAIAVVLCLVFLGGLEGVREGTLIAAFLVGGYIQVYHKLLFRFVERFLPAYR